MTRFAKATVDRPGRNVKQKSGLNREVLDVSPATLIAMIAYKAKEGWGKIRQDRCKGHVADMRRMRGAGPKGLKYPIHTCPHCKTEVHRDVNAARSIQKAGRSGSVERNAEKNG